jgi:hypothetical protein
MTDHGIATDYSLFRRYDCSPRKSPAELHCISVTDSNGVPVTGLAAGNFEVDSLIVGPGGALVNIVGVSPGRLAGFYLGTPEKARSAAAQLVSAIKTR